MRTLLPYIIIAFFCFWQTVLNAQDSFHVRRFTSNDGLSQGIVQDILQDKNGYIWLSTWNGLNKYDGYTFRSFKSYPGEGAALSSNRIVSMAENASGDIWCRTQEQKAYLFDVQTEQFRDVLKPYLQEFSEVHIRKIICLENDVTWLLTSDNTCFRVDEKKLDTNEAVSIYGKETKGWHCGVVSQIKLDKDGDEWVLTDKGVNLLGKKRMDSDFPFRYMTEKGERFWLIAQNGQFAEYHPKHGVRFMDRTDGVEKVFQMKAISDTLLTVGTDAGLWIIHIPDGKMERVDVRSASQPSSDVLSVFKDSSKRLWMFTNSQGVLKYDMDTRECTHLMPPVKPDASKDEKMEHPFVFEDALGVIRVNPRYGYLSYYDEKSGLLKPYRNPDGSVLKSDIRISLIDRQKNIWYGEVRNLYHMTFFHSRIDYLSEMKNTEVRSLFVDKQNKLWVGSKDGCLRIYNKEYNTEPLYVDAAGNISRRPVRFLGNVYCMKADKEGALWLGTRGQGLVRLTHRPVGDGYDVMQFVFDKKDEYSISSNDIYALYQDRKGHLWIGAYKGGLNLLQKQDGKFYFIHGGNRLKNYPFPYMKSKVRTLVETADGIMLAGASEGLLTFSADFTRPEEIKFHLHTAEYERSDGMTCTEVMNICNTSEGVFLATSTGGFNKILSTNLSDSSLKFQGMGVRDGWMSDLALSVVETPQKDLWFVTENLLIHKNHNQVLEYYGNAFFRKDLFFSEASPVCLPDGRLVFATTDYGVMLLSPKRLRERTYVPPLMFTGLRVRGHSENYSLDNKDKIVLKPDERYVTFQFAALDYANTSGIQYAYRLRGLDKDWNFCGTMRSANYNNLPPGEYVLELRSTNGDGIWTEQAKTLDVIIEPTFWETPWAWVLYSFLLVMLVLLVAYILFYIYRLRHKVDVEQQLAEVKLRFFTDISHELRTPLTLIGSPIDEVLEHEKSLSELSRTHLSLAQKNVNRMLQLVNQLLDFRKIQSRKMKLLVEDTNLIELLERISDSFRLLAEEHGITFRFVHENTMLNVWVDCDKLEKICYNLLSNAFKYTEDNGQITLKLIETGKGVDIVVEDSGVGIAADRMAGLFERFETLASRSFSQPSSGIGLSLVKEFVELHHGSIDVKSTPGEGSVFIVHLLKGRQHLEKDALVEFILTDSKPEEEELETADNTIDTQTDDEEVVNETLSVLVVEDNEELRVFLYSILSEEYKVYLAANGKEGLNVVREQSPDLIVSDVMMPVMDGLEMVRCIKSDPVVCHTPIILLTAKSSLDDRIAGLEQGIDDYITKPFSASYLKVKIQNLLAKRKEWQEAYRALLMKKESPNFSPSEPHITTYDQDFMERLMAFMEQNMDNSSLKVDEMAGAMNLSRAVFYVKLKTITGLSPIDFLRDMRIKRACQLLVSDKYSMSQVAYMTGFKDPKFFSRTFRKIMQCSPTEYREKYLSSNLN